MLVSIFGNTHLYFKDNKCNYEIIFKSCMSLSPYLSGPKKQSEAQLIIFNLNILKYSFMWHYVALVRMLQYSKESLYALNIFILLSLD